MMPPLPDLPAEPARPPVAEPLIDRSIDTKSAAQEDALRPAERWRRIAAVAEAFAENERARAELAVAIGYPPEAYDQFRRDIPLRPPPRVDPSHAEEVQAVVVVDATVAAPFLIRATLRSLQDQSQANWTAQVVAPDAIRDHPVGAFADTDPRIRFVAAVDAAFGDATVVLIDAGTILDPEALAWLGFAMSRTGAAAAFADHDHGIADPGLRLVRADPVLFGAFDRNLMAEAGPPAIVAARGAIVGDRESRGDVLLAAAGSVASVPRILATRLSLSLIARDGRASGDDDIPGRLSPLPHDVPARVSPRPREDRIAIVMPTRDSAGLLARAIDTLRKTARAAARLDIVVVDNRSERDETRALFARLADDGAARTIAMDTPFNWSLASNLGAAASDAPLVAFVNNDIEMLAAGWDDGLADALADPSVGAVGARLVYPGRTIQHAGVAFGFGPGGTEHEGRGVSADEPGPYRRYVTSHAVASVTGAFLSVRRADFDRVGGFDAERLMIAHSDVDLCLKLREIGLTILYCPAIEAIHHEGATRGTNETRAAIAWDEGERADLIDRWGDALFEDPGISPYWQRGGAPFELLREPSLREILAHLDRSARPDPWRPTRRAAQSIRDW